VSGVRALQVIDTLGMGGAETWLMEVLRRWARSGEAFMDFLVTSGAEGVFDAEARALGARLHYLRYGRRSALSFGQAFRAILAKGRYDAIHDHQDFSSGWHFLMGAGALPPVRVTHVHNPAYQIRNNYGVTASRRIVASIGRGLVRRYATCVTGTSRQVLSEYGFDAPAFARIPKAALHCGFDTARFDGDREVARAAVREEHGWPAASPLVLFAGRIDQSAELDHPQNHKNSAFAVCAALACLRICPGARFLFAGAPSPAVAILEQRVAAQARADHFAFVGVRRDIERLMLASDVLLFPSRGEGLGMVAVEAQAASLPVLASTAVPRECVVVPELVRFLDLAQGEDAWGGAIAALLANPPRVDGANERVAASAFGIAQSAAALRRLYETGRA